jgi:hypothetical protein
MQCVECLQDSDCANSTNGKVCSFINKCVECEDGDYQCVTSGAAAEGTFSRILENINLIRSNPL